MSERLGLVTKMKPNTTCNTCGAELPTTDAPCPRCLVALALEPDRDPASRREVADDWVGPYRVLQKLGEGGMGIVYRAQQNEPVRRQVAVKVVKAGMDSRAVLKRFDVERQALALMDHPNIARVFDAGETETGRPYFVMELVHGEPINAFCDRVRRSTNERLELFITVCRAIQHAHQKGVIHRDLKPSNVLVSEVDGKAFPTVIDFGIAKAIAAPLTDATAVTRLGTFIGTPEYMSPEQAGGDPAAVDTRSDVYALGALLHGLLIGCPPFEPETLHKLSYAALIQMLNEQEPLRPSTRLERLGAQAAAVAANQQTDAKALIRQLREDLDWIVLKTLAKDPARRYASAAALAVDVERFLRDEPVLAGPPGKVYRLRKFVRRYRAGVTLAASIAIGTLATGAVLIYFLLQSSEQNTEISRLLTQTEQARSEAVGQAATAEQTSEFLVSLFEVSDPGEARGNTITASEILERGAQRIESELQEQPRVRAQMMSTIGKVYMQLGLYDPAEPLIEGALRELEQTGNATDLELAKSTAELGLLRHAQGNFEAAEGRLREALAVQEAQLGTDHPTVAATLNGLGLVLSSRGEFGEARALHTRALQIYEAAYPEESKEVADSLNNLAIVAQAEMRLDEVQPLVERSLAIMQKVHGVDHPDVTTLMQNLGVLHATLKNWDEAERIFEDVIDSATRVLGAEHPDLAQSLSNLAIVYEGTDRLAEAEQLRWRTLAMYENSFGPDHVRVASPLTKLAVLFNRQQRYEEAIPLIKRLREIRIAALGSDHIRIGQAYRYEANVRVSMEDYPEAERLFGLAQEVYEGAEGRESPTLVLLLREFANTPRKLDKQAEATALEERAATLESAA